MLPGFECPVEVSKREIIGSPEGGVGQLKQHHRAAKVGWTGPPARL